MNNSVPLPHRKESAGGALERVALLIRHGIVLEGLGELAMAPFDDVLAAAAAAWTAQRIARGTASSLLGTPELADGRPEAIWY